MADTLSLRQKEREIETYQERIEAERDRIRDRQNEIYRNTFRLPGFARIPKRKLNQEF